MEDKEFEEYGEDVGEENITPSEEEDLLFSIEPGPRIFNLNNTSGTTLLGVLLEETEDSFLIGLPSRLIDVSGEMKIEPYMPIPFSRFLKSGISSLTFLFGVFSEKYIEYLKTTGKVIAPEIVSRMYFDGDEEDRSSEDPMELILEPDEDIEERVKNAQQLGGLILNGSNTKH